LEIRKQAKSLLATYGERSKGIGMSASVCIKRLGGCWFAVALNNQDELVCSTLSRKGESDVQRSLAHTLRRYIRAESREDSHASSLLNALYSMYQGKPTSIDTKLSTRFITPFYQEVYQKTRSIPRGRVTTYGAIAESLGSKKLSRAVGNAMAANPFVLVVPCHRVVRSTLETGIYGRGPELKPRLLRREGVSFNGRKVSEASVWTPPRR
jgi:O-6-methylguanine DNA methyltransferase